MTDSLILAHGGRLVDLLLSPEAATEVRESSADWASWDLTPRQMCDLELLLNGAFSPLTGFMGRADYEGVRDSMHLVDGTLWSMPVVLDVTQEFGDSIEEGASIALRDAEVVIDTTDVSPEGPHSRCSCTWRRRGTSGRRKEGLAAKRASDIEFRPTTPQNWTTPWPIPSS